MVRLSGLRLVACTVAFWRENFELGNMSDEHDSIVEAQATSSRNEQLNISSTSTCQDTSKKSAPSVGAAPGSTYLEAVPEETMASKLVIMTFRVVTKSLYLFSGF